MALPKINESVYYEKKIPSTGKKIEFRPYLVKEEKLLMQAFETGSHKLALKTVVNTIGSCLKENVDVKKLATFDIEYLFTQIRAKSVGETSTILINCSECSAKNEVTIDVSKLEVNVPKKKDNVIKITDTVSVKMRYPLYEHIENMDLENPEDIETNLELIFKCIENIMTPEENIKTDDVPKTELKEFVESMTSSQFSKIVEFIQNIPSLQKDISCTCKGCGNQIEKRLKGIQDFLS